MAFSSVTVAQPSHQFWTLGTFSDQSSIVVGFLPTLDEATPVILGEDLYLTLSDSVGAPR